MYIVAIGWLYVVLMMSVSETSVVAGVMTFFWYGLMPVALLLWLMGRPSRRKTSLAEQGSGKPDGTDTQAD